MEAKKIRQEEIIYQEGILAVVPLRKEYLDEQYRKWMFNQEVTKFNTHGLFPKSDESFLTFANSLNKEYERIDWAIVTDRIDPNWGVNYSSGFYYHIGNASLYFNYNYRSVEFACLIGETDWWGKGVMTQVMKWALQHCFDKLGMNRVWTGTAATNIGMNYVASKNGMKQEGVFKEAMFLNGEYVDINEWGIVKSEWDRMKTQKKNEGKVFVGTEQELHDFQMGELIHNDPEHE